MIRSFHYLCAVAFALMVYGTQSHAKKAECTDVSQAAAEIQKAIEHYDTKTLSLYMESGAWFTDTHISKKQLLRMLVDKSSWFYEKLFIGPDSWRSYFKSVSNISAKTINDGKYVYVSYFADHPEGLIPPSIIVWCHNGKWHIVDMHGF